MYYRSTVLATNFGQDPWLVRLLRRVLFFIPQANPDNEKLYRQVREWYLELDDAGVPVREIGLGAAGVPLFGAPDERNFGFWTDSTEPLPPDHLSPISADEFEELWQQV